LCLGWARHVARDVTRNEARVKKKIGKGLN